MSAALEARALTKVFPGVVALDSVDFTVHPGEVHCLVGENGAGKSTLIKCLTGVYKPDGGQVLVGGTDTATDRDLFQRIAYVPQEIDLFPQMTVAENLFLPFRGAGGRSVRASRLAERARPVLERFKIAATPGAAAGTLPVADQQLLQIARATMAPDYDVLILDEPTASLSEEDTERVFSVVRDVQREGRGVVYISHKLEELAVLGDRVTAFRNGRHVGEAPIAEADRAWILRQMTGREIDGTESFVPRGEPGRTLLTVDGATGRGYADMSFEVREGEVLGIAGLVGAGRTELMRGIFGVDPLDAGTVRLEGSRAGKRTSRDSVRDGLLYVPEDRKRLGILPLMSVAENITILAAGAGRGTAGESTGHQGKAALAADAIRRYDVRTGSPSTPIRFLSGGNQQKAIIARAMLANPRVVIFDEPTKGIDVAAKYEIYRLIRSLAEEKGLAVVIVSSEVEELLKCANRVITMHRGTFVCETAQPISKDRLVASLFGYTEGEKTDHE